MFPFAISPPALVYFRKTFLGKNKSQCDVWEMRLGQAWDLVLNGVCSTHQQETLMRASSRQPNCASAERSDKARRRMQQIADEESAK